MTRNETIEILNYLGRLYMLQMKKLTDAEKRSMVDVWADQFHDTPYDKVYRAVRIYANKGKPFLPGPPDIINELIRIDEHGDHKLFNLMREAARMAYEGEEHIVIDDLGGVRRDDSSPTGYRPVPAEAHLTRNYTQADFAALPIEIQEYAEDVNGLKKIHEEIESNPAFARRRFVESMPYMEARRTTE